MQGFSWKVLTNKFTSEHPLCAKFHARHCSYKPEERGLLPAVKSQVSQESTMMPCQKCYNRASENRGDPTRGKDEDIANIQRRHSRKC